MKTCTNYDRRNTLVCRLSGLWKTLSVNTVALLINTMFVAIIPTVASNTQFVMGHNINKRETQLLVHTLPEVKEATECFV